MPGARIATAITAIVMALAVILFFQTKDPMFLIFGLQLASLAWIVVLIVYVWQRGIPVRIVSDERKGP